LVLSLLLTLALTMVALGVLAVGTREATVAAAVVRKARAERLAESAAAEALRGWSTRAVADLPVGGDRRLATAGPDRTATVSRLDSGLYLVRGEGRVPAPAGPVVASAGVMVRTLPPITDALAGAVTATEQVTVSGGAVDGLGGEAGVGCDGIGSPGIVAPVVTVASGADVAGAPAVERAVPPPPPLPDPLGPTLAEGIADVNVLGLTATPRPRAAADRCLPGRRNWGSTDPRHPCFNLLPVVFADAGLTVAGGVGRGVLVVDGDLTITGGAVFEGVVVVRGHLRIDEGSLIRGAVRARSVHLADGTVARGACALAAATAAPALDRAFRPPSRWWVPVF